jgi:hypothetical protein
MSEKVNHTKRLTNAIVYLNKKFIGVCEENEKLKQSIQSRDSLIKEQQELIDECIKKIEGKNTCIKNLELVICSLSTNIAFMQMAIESKKNKRKKFLGIF